MTARGFAKTIGTSAKDQQYINCLFESAINPALGKKAIYVVKRPGSTTGSSIGATCYALASYSTYFTGMSCTATAIFRGTTSLGAIGNTVKDLFLSDTVMDEQEVICFAVDTTAAYFCFKDAVTTNFPTFTGDTHTNTVIDNIASTVGLYPGQVITGTGIQAATRIATITSATAITTTLATTATNAGVTITKEAIAKIIDADFPASDIQSVTAMNGYMFTATSDKIYNCPINTPWLQTASDYISADYSGDTLVRIWKYGDYIVAVGANSIQYFQITGNSSGSVLSAVRALNKTTDRQINFQPIFVGGFGYVTSSSDAAGYAIMKMGSATEMVPVTDPITGGVLGGNGPTALGMATITGDRKLVMPCDGNNTQSLVYDDSSKMCSLYKLASANILTSFGTTFTKSGATTLFTWAAGNTWTDSTVAYTMTIQTEPFVLNNGRPFTISMVELIGDTQASGTTTFTTYNDDYTTALSLSAFDMTAQNKVSRPCGYYPNHVIFKLEHSANTAFRAQALKVHWEPAG